MTPDQEVEEGQAHKAASKEQKDQDALPAPSEPQIMTPPFKLRLPKNVLLVTAQPMQCKRFYRQSFVSCQALRVSSMR